MREAWVDTTLGEVVKIYGGVSPANVAIVPEGGVPFVKVEELNTCQKYLTAARENVVGGSPIVPVGCVLFPKRGGAIMTNKVRLSAVPIVIDTNMMALQPMKRRLDAEYLFYFIALQQLKRIADVSSVPQINNKHINPFPITLPPLSEQRRIVEILRTWDEAIDKTLRLIAAEEMRLSWFRSECLMGMHRLPGHESKWNTPRLGEILIEHKLKSTGNEKVFSVSVHKGLINQVEHLGRSFAAKETGNYNLVRPGDIVYTKSPTGDFPLGIIKQSKIDESVIVSPLYGVFTPVNPNIGVMLDAFFDSPINTQNYLAPLVQKGPKNTIAITNKRFLEGCFNVPTDVGEQAALADLVSTAKIEIDALRKRVDKLERQKRGLMQKLLTGKWLVSLRDDVMPNSVPHFPAEAAQ